MKKSQNLKLILLILCSIAIMLQLTDTYVVPVIPILAFIVVLLIFIQKRRINGITSSCAIIFLSGFIGYFSAQKKNSVAGTSIGMILPVDYFNKTFSMFCLAAMFISFGSSLRKNANSYYSASALNGINKNLVSNNPSTYLLSLMPLFGAFIGFGFSQLISRSTHLTIQQFPIFARVSLAASLIALGVLSLWTKQQTKLLRFIGFLGIFCYALLFFSLSSRYLTFIPICVAFVCFKKSSRLQTIFLLFVSVFSTLFCYMLPLFLRSLTNHGFVPYAANMRSITFRATDFQAAFQNFIFSFDVNGLTAFSLQEFPLRDLLVEVSPLPGDLAGWYKISDMHRLNSATPAAAIGEAMNYGFINFILLFSIIGLAMGYMQDKVDSFPPKLRVYSNIVLTSGSVYFAVLCLQYNLRSAIRIIYYLFVYFFLVKITVNKKSNDSDNNFPLDYREM